MNPGSAEITKHYVPFGVYKVDNRETKRMFMFESSGTQVAYALLLHFLPALTTDGVAVIDELGTDPHPRMLLPIMDLFLSLSTNPHNAQIVFTCYVAEILNLLPAEAAGHAGEKR